MKISRLIQKRNKVCILFDEGENLYLRYDTVLKFGLKKNDEVNEDFLSQLTNEDYRLQLKELSFRLLSRRMHSVFELKRKLLTKKYPPERIEEAVNELAERNYLNDVVFAEKYAEEKFKTNKTGIIKIKAELLRKGVDKKTIDSVLLKFENSEEGLKNALAIACKKIESIRYKNIETKKKKEKLFRFLLSKGYSHEIIKITLEKLHFDEGSSDFVD